MDKETLAEIPSPPRPVRWGRVLGRRWILGLIGGSMLLTGLMMLVLLVGFAGLGLPFDDLALDERAETARGRVSESVALRSDDRLMRVRFSFRSRDGRRWQGMSYATHPGFEPGLEYAVEYLEEAPMINRLAGTTKSMTGLWITLPVGLLVLPGIALLLVWFRGVLQLKVMLTDASAAEATITAAKLLRHVNPNQIAVEYHFEDRGGAEQTGGHRVLASSPLGRRLLDGMDLCAVLFDEGKPQRSRLVGPEHFGRPG